MLNFWGNLFKVLLNAVFGFLTRTVLVKLAIFAFVYAFVFALLPLLFKWLVPSAIQHGYDYYLAFLENTDPWGWNIAYLIDWWQGWTLIPIFWIAVTCRFIFRRI